MRHNQAVFGVVIPMRQRRRLKVWGRALLVALLWIGVGFHFGARFDTSPATQNQPEILALLAALKGQVMQLEERWRMVVGEDGTPAGQAPLPPFPWANNALSVPAISAATRLR